MALAAGFLKICRPDLLLPGLALFVSRLATPVSGDGDVMAGIFHGIARLESGDVRASASEILGRIRK